MKQRLKELGVLLLVLAALGIAVMASGIVPIAASSGHWAVTEWILNFSSSRSVSTHSIGIKVPPLDEDGMVRLGAGIYQSNCQWCHGHPGLKHPRVAAQMTPQPPYLPNVLHQWDAAERYYIVKHGIKFAGMPAWPAQQRDDEVWPLVAFLQVFPELDSAGYQRLLGVREEEPGDRAAGEVPVPMQPVERLVASACAMCHGMHGLSRAGDRVPVLAGQNQPYLAASLLAYQAGERHSGIMEPIAARLSEQQIEQLAGYFADQAPSIAAAAASQSELARTDQLQRPPSDAWLLGRKLVHEGDQAEKIPSCIDCHGSTNLAGEEPVADENLRQQHAGYPQLAGQSAWYISNQLRLFNKRHRGGTENFPLMHPVADNLDKSQREAVARYYQSLAE